MSGGAVTETIKPAILAKRGLKVNKFFCAAPTGGPHTGGNTFTVLTGLC
jgi:hypothetical protein